jgi:subtilisin family serine protease
MMQRQTLAVLSIVVLLSSLLVAVVPVSAGAESQRYVVVFEEGIPKNAAKLVKTAGGELVKSFPQVGVSIATSTSADFAASLEGASGILAVGGERFLALPAGDAYLDADAPDPAVDTGYFNYQWDIRRVGADQAWDITTGSHDTVVAVLDTGIAYNHPDLAPNVVYNACYTAIAENCNPYPSIHWHGTHVAGTIAAAFGGGAAVGVGPNLGLANYNVFELTGEGVVAYDEALWEAMFDVVDQGFGVINMSLGGYIVRSDSPEDVAVWTAWNRVANYVTRQGVTIVASSGNGDANLNGSLDHIPSDVPAIISVGATGIRTDPVYPQAGAYDVRAFYSNYGAAVTLVAPGGDFGPDDPAYPYYWYLIYSDYVVANPACAATASCPIGYAWAGGTSMAAPHVSGAAGLLVDLNPKLKARQVTAILKQTAEDLGDRQMYGHGMLDVAAAVSK